MGERVGVLQHGVLAQMSTPEELYHRPASPYVADFVGDAVFCPGIAEAGRVHCALGALTLAAAGLTGPVSVMIRPEQIRLGSAGALNAVPALLKDVAFYGRDAVVTLGLEGALAGDVTARVFSQAVPPPGAKVWLTVEGKVVAYPAPVSGAGTEAAMT